jgi:hypothetical protein
MGESHCVRALFTSSKPEDKHPWKYQYMQYVHKTLAVTHQHVYGHRPFVVLAEQLGWRECMCIDNEPSALAISVLLTTGQNPFLS